MQMISTVPEMSLAEFWDRLHQHDWFYSYSDDSGVCRRGRANEQRLETIAMRSGREYEQLMKDFRAHHFSGRNFSMEEAPMPPRPAD